MSPRKYKFMMLAVKKKLIEKVGEGEKKSCKIAKEFNTTLSTLLTLGRCVS